MNYVFVLFMSLLVPYTFDISNIKYTQDVGFMLSNQEDFSSWGVKVLNTESTVTEVRKEPTPGGFYAVTYEFFTQYNVYLRDKLWVAPRLSFSPLREGIDVIFAAKGSSGPGTPTRLYYNEYPAMGVMLGYDVWNSKGMSMESYNIAPYVGASLLRVAYAGASDFTTNQYFDSTTKFHFGTQIRMGQSWNLVAEYAFYRLNYFNIEGLSDRMVITVNKLKFGLSYSFIDYKYYHKANKDDTYHNIIKSIDPNLDYKVQERERLKRRATENERRDQLNSPTTDQTTPIVDDMAALSEY
jgi:hypothetical protein